MVAAIRMHKRPRSETTRMMTDSSVVNDGTDLAPFTTSRTLEPSSFRATKRSRPNINNNSDNNDSNPVLQKEGTGSDAAAGSEPQLSQGSVEHHNESSPITKKVRFSNQEPQVISFSWFDDLTDEEEAQLRLQMWYTVRFCLTFKILHYYVSGAELGLP